MSCKKKFQRNKPLKKEKERKFFELSQHANFHISRFIRVLFLRDVVVLMEAKSFQVIRNFNFRKTKKNLQ